jgi:hypothetical protein
MTTNDPAGVESTGTTTDASPAETAVDWNGPFSEQDAYGEPTGYTYLKCPACGIEVLTDTRSHATHRRGCLHR